MKAKYNNLYKFLFLIFTMIGYSMTANADENILLLELKDGVVTIEMKPEVAPNHVKRIKELVNDGLSVSLFILKSFPSSLISISGLTPTSEIDFPDGR
mgnify:CR=1 FL=1